jgi:hypothetical protein
LVEKREGEPSHWNYMPSTKLKGRPTIKREVFFEGCQSTGSHRDGSLSRMVQLRNHLLFRPKHWSWIFAEIMSFEEQEKSPAATHVCCGDFNPFSANFASSVHTAKNKKSQSSTILRTSQRQKQMPAIDSADTAHEKGTTAPHVAHAKLKSASSPRSTFVCFVWFLQ